MIKISNSKSGVTTIDIEGVIGVPEEWQFEEPAGRVATYEKFRRSLAAISQIRGTEVVVNIRSTGGDVGDAMLIHDALSGLAGDIKGGGNGSAGQLRITTRCFGYVASAATIIAQAASEGGREISKNALYLIHNSVGNCEGNARDFRSSEELLAKTDQRIAGIYAVRSGREAAGFIDLMAENNGSGRWLSPEEALAEGLVDRIVESGQRPEETSLSDLGPARNERTDGGLLNKLRKTARAAARGNRAENAQKPSPKSAEAIRYQQDVELERLRHRISTLESENAQLKAKPTQTKTKEDPSLAESRRSANENSYIRDVESFTSK